MSNAATARPHDAGTFLFRSAGLFVFWLVLTGGGAKDIVPGIIAALIAGRVSIGLLPAGALAFSPLAALTLVFRFLQQSILAGVYVARCALDPRLPIKPGTFAYKPELGEGPARDAFLTWSSLQPGTLPSGPDGAGGIIVHCLDMRAPAAAQLVAEERRFTRALAVAE